MTFAPFMSEPVRPASLRVAAQTTVIGVRVLVPSGIITVKRQT